MSGGGQVNGDVKALSPLGRGLGEGENAAATEIILKPAPSPGGSASDLSPGGRGFHPPLAGLALAWRLARRELRGGVKGFPIFIACLALGVAAIAAVQS
ncbi:MAG TPA: hypothetical protein PKZ97_13445, partial [Azospirillaceae bacterium]|nr:hypothetical protein [Azospirillaceae bacterium]